MPQGKPEHFFDVAYYKRPVKTPVIRDKAASVAKEAEVARFQVGTPEPHLRDAVFALMSNFWRATQVAPLHLPHPVWWYSQDKIYEASKGA